MSLRTCYLLMTKNIIIEDITMVDIIMEDITTVNIIMEKIKTYSKNSLDSLKMKNLKNKLIKTKSKINKSLRYKKPNNLNLRTTTKCKNL